MSTPYFPLYPADFEADTSHLTLEEDGAYNRLLRLMWMTPECNLPDDDAWIKRRMRVDADTYERVVKPLIAEFMQRRNGRVFSARLTEEFKKVDLTSRKRSAAGKMGGRPQASENKQKHEKPGLDFDKGGLSYTRVLPEPEPYIDSEDKSSGKMPIQDRPEKSISEVLWSSGLGLLTKAGKSDGQARSIIGKWRKVQSDEVILAALGKAQREGALDPVAFAEGCFRQAKKTEQTHDFWTGPALN